MANPWWYDGCLQNIKNLGGTLCPQVHCDSTIVKNYSEAYCNCEDTYPNGCSPNRTPNCCSYSATSPVPIISEGCYCCCGCFANETPVAVSMEDYKAIAEFAIGDMVYVADNAELSQWSQQQVLFSNGAGGDQSSTVMIKLTYETDDGVLDHLFVSRDQLFYMPDQKMKAASRLVPEQDKLVYYDGTTATVKSLEAGLYKKGLHHIATSIGPATELGCHLILAKGIVCADYALQLGLNRLQEPHASLAAEHISLPEFGTKAYYEKYTAVTGHAGKAHAEDFTPEKFDKTVFVPFSDKGSVTIPDHAQYFISKAQALSILDNPEAHIFPVYSGIGDEMVKYQFLLFGGFYPEVTFYYDRENQVPNAYSFFEYGKAFVVVNGGLVRTSCFTYDTLAFVIAHELGHLYGGNPINEHDYTCEGKADFFAVTGVLPKVMYGITAGPVVKETLQILPVFFDLISPELRKGQKGNTCMRISTDCRLEAINAAFTMQALPACAGGPVDPKLIVESVTVQKSKKGTNLIVAYNIPVDPATAIAIGNYVFDPVVAVNAARMDTKNPAVVILSVAISTPGSYSLCVYDVLSAEGEPLINGENCNSFNY